MLLCALAAEAQTQRIAVDATAHAERVLANMPRFEQIQQEQPSKTVDTADRSLDALERRLPTADALKSADAAAIQAMLASLPSEHDLADAATASAVEQIEAIIASHFAASQRTRASEGTQQDLAVATVAARTRLTPFNFSCRSAGGAS